MHYFIWEKQSWHNLGISLKLSTSKYCYIKPTMSSTWANFDRRQGYDKPYENYFLCQEKTIFWLWFRLTFIVNIDKKYEIKANYDTEYFFDLLPSFLNIDGHLYHFNMIKGLRGYTFSYDKNKSEGGERLKVIDSHKLNHSAEKMVEWLYEFGYVQYMPYGYKEKYEKVFNTKIKHSRVSNY